MSRPYTFPAMVFVPRLPLVSLEDRGRVAVLRVPARVEQFLHLARSAIVGEQRETQVAVVAFQQVAEISEPETQVCGAIEELFVRQPWLVQPRRAGEHLGVADRPRLALRIQTE